MWFDSQLEVKVSSDADYIHDITYNYYGNRLAMCTSGHKISVWDRDESTGAWQESAVMEAAHGAPIWRLAWAHPEYGQVLASCSNDGHLQVWKEMRKGFFEKTARMVDAAKSIPDVKFCPKKHGLKLAAPSLDGFCRIYEAQDLLNLSAWNTEDIHSHRNGDSYGSTCCSWMENADNPTIAVGGCDGTIAVFTRGAVRNRWEKLDQFQVHSAPVKDMAWAPNLCRPYEILATVGEEDVATLFKWDNDSLQKLQVLDCGEPDLWRVAWNITGTLLAVSPESGQVSVWKTDAGHKWFNVCDIASPGVN